MDKPTPVKQKPRERQFSAKPNIVYILTDNLGYGELGCYGGGELRGAPTPRADRLAAVKWRNWKLAFYEETRDWFGTPAKLTLPKLFNLATDPKEEYPEETLRNTWAMDRCRHAIREFYDSLKIYPAVPEGTRDPYRPPAPTVSAGSKKTG